MKIFHGFRVFFIILGLSLSFGFESNAQKEFSFPSSNDLGLNITGLLSSFLGNSNSEISPESFPFVVKMNRNKLGIRFGLGLELGKTDESLVGIEQIVFNNFGFNARVGIERKKYLGFKTGFFYGIDLISHLRNSEDVVSNEIDLSNISENTVGGGFGPVFGFEYYLNEHLYFGTEGSFYFMYRYTNRTETFQFNSAINTMSTITEFSSQISSPSRLYVMIRF